jgi:hypothetical protein
VKPWLEPVQEALDSSPRPIDFFFRDDDAGWDDERLFQLLDVFRDHAIPLDLALIPIELTPALAEELSRRAARIPDRLRVHQHGFAHINHETVGRKCEFGPERDYLSQKSDIARGQQRLAQLCEPLTDPIFTPPWNRCTAVTGNCLVELGFQVLSRESSVSPLAIPGLKELPIHLDWFAHRKGVRLTREQWGESLAEKVKTLATIGIMFHHAVMDGVEMQATAELLALLANHRQVQSRTMWSLNLQDPAQTNATGL